jgi:hypothetical protein
MTTPAEGGNERRSAPFPFKELARVLVLPVIAVVIFLLLFMNRSGDETSKEKRGLKRIELVQKDASFQPIPADKGGATGRVWYTPSGRAFSFELEAAGLKPHRRYLIEVEVDRTVYVLASRAANRRGDLAVDTTLTSFAEGVCVGPNYDPPEPLAGPHAIRFWVKADGTPPSGAERHPVPGLAQEQELPCSGNGDGDYGYVLLENEIANYVGTGTAGEGGGGRTGGGKRSS